MSAYSPGPWKLQEWTARDSDGAVEGGGMQVVDANGHMISACTVEGSSEQEEADARLIAAAPDLLAAAMEVAEWVTQRPKTHPYDAFKALEAAIAKATGAALSAGETKGGQ